MFDDLTKALADIHINQCKADVSREGSNNGTGWNKLHTYRLFKKDVKMEWQHKETIVRLCSLYLWIVFYNVKIWEVYVPICLPGNPIMIRLLAKTCWDIVKCRKWYFL